MMCISSHPQVSERAFEIFQDRLQNGRKGDALSDWLEAEREIRKHRIPVLASMLHLHPKPTALALNLRGFRPHPPPTRLHTESIRRSAIA
jgi:hypothetical protein